MLERSAKVRVQGQWGGNARAGGIGLGGSEGGDSFMGSGWGKTPIQRAREFPPKWLRASLLLASLTLSQEALRLPKITL